MKTEPGSAVDEALAGDPLGSLDEAAKALYSTVREAWSAKPAGVSPRKPDDFEDLDSAVLGDWHPNEGSQPPPPRSGTWPYRALVRVYEYAGRGEALISELAACSHKVGPRRAWDVLGTITASQSSLRWCWLEGAPFLQWWANSLNFSVYSLGDAEPVLPVARGTPALIPGIAFHAGQHLLATVGLEPSPPEANRIDGLALALGHSCNAYVRAFEGACQADSPLAAAARLNGLMIAGAALCTASAAFALDPMIVYVERTLLTLSVPNDGD